MIRTIQGIIDWAKILLNGITEINLTCLGLWAVVLVVVLGSAFASATIAEMRMRGMFIHFFGGLILPWIYPILIGAKLSPNLEVAKVRKQERDLENRLGVNMAFLRTQFNSYNREQKKAGQPQLEFRDWIAQYEADKQAKVEAEVRREREVIAPTNSVSRTLLEGLSVDADGNRKGPFRVKTLDGRELKVEQIKNIMEDVAAFEVIDPPTGKLRSIRVKYANIKSFETVEQ